MTCTGVTDLVCILRSMEPLLDITDTYEFLSVPLPSSEATACRDVLYSVWCPRAVATCCEAEGLTLVVPTAVLREWRGRDTAWPEKLREVLTRAGPPRMRRITMMVHSSLSAVGFTAAFSHALGEAGVSCNVFAGFYHDHLFVAEEDAERAVTVLQELQKQ